MMCDIDGIAAALNLLSSPITSAPDRRTASEYLDHIKSSKSASRWGLTLLSAFNPAGPLSQTQIDVLSFGIQIIKASLRKSNDKSQDFSIRDDPATHISNILSMARITYVREMTQLTRQLVDLSARIALHCIHTVDCTAVVSLGFFSAISLLAGVPKTNPEIPNLPIAVNSFLPLLSPTPATVQCDVYLLAEVLLVFGEAPTMSSCPARLRSLLNSVVFPALRRLNTSLRDELSSAIARLEVSQYANVDASVDNVQLVSRAFTALCRVMVQWAPLMGELGEARGPDAPLGTNTIVGLLLRVEAILADAMCRAVAVAAVPASPTPPIGLLIKHSSCREAVYELSIVAFDATTSIAKAVTSDKWGRLLPQPNSQLEAIAAMCAAVATSLYQTSTAATTRLWVAELHRGRRESMRRKNSSSDFEAGDAAARLRASEECWVLESETCMRSFVYMHTAQAVLLNLERAVCQIVTVLAPIVVPLLLWDLSNPPADPDQQFVLLTSSVSNLEALKANAGTIVQTFAGFTSLAWSPTTTVEASKILSTVALEAKGRLCDGDAELRLLMMFAWESIATSARAGVQQLGTSSIDAQSLKLVNEALRHAFWTGAGGAAYPLALVVMSPAGRKKFGQFRNDVRKSLRTYVASAGALIGLSQDAYLAELHSCLTEDMSAEDHCAQVEALLHTLSSVPITADSPNSETIVYKLIEKSLDYASDLSRREIVRVAFLSICRFSDFIVKVPRLLDRTMDIVTRALLLPQVDELFPFVSKEDHVAAVTLQKLSHCLTLVPSAKTPNLNLIFESLLLLVQSTFGPAPVASNQSVALVASSLGVCCGVAACQSHVPPPADQFIRLLLQLVSDKNVQPQHFTFVLNAVEAFVASVPPPSSRPPSAILADIGVVHATRPIFGGRRNRARAIFEDLPSLREIENEFLAGSRAECVDGQMCPLNSTLVRTVAESWPSIVNSFVWMHCPPGLELISAAARILIVAASLDCPNEAAVCVLLREWHALVSNCIKTHPAWSQTLMNHFIPLAAVVPIEGGGLVADSAREVVRSFIFSIPELTRSNMAPSDLGVAWEGTCALLAVPGAFQVCIQQIMLERRLAWCVVRLCLANILRSDGPLMARLVDSGHTAIVGAGGAGYASRLLKWLAFPMKEPRSPLEVRWTEVMRELMGEKVASGCRVASLIFAILFRCLSESGTALDNFSVVSNFLDVGYCVWVALGEVEARASFFEACTLIGAPATGPLFDMLKNNSAKKQPFKKALRRVQIVLTCPTHTN